MWCCCKVGDEFWYVDIWIIVERIGDWWNYVCCFFFIKMVNCVKDLVCGWGNFVFVFVECFFGWYGDGGLVDIFGYCLVDVEYKCYDGCDC